MLLIAWAFRNFGWAAFRYGIAAIVALLHDALIVLGIFAILGFFLKVEVDSLFVTRSCIMGSGPRHEVVFAASARIAA